MSRHVRHTSTPIGIFKRSCLHEPVDGGDVGVGTIAQQPRHRRQVPSSASCKRGRATSLVKALRATWLPSWLVKAFVGKRARGLERRILHQKQAQRQDYQRLHREVTSTQVEGGGVVAGRVWGVDVNPLLLDQVAEANSVTKQGAAPEQLVLHLPQRACVPQDGKRVAQAQARGVVGYVVLLSSAALSAMHAHLPCQRPRTSKRLLHPPGSSSRRQGMEER
jgi:hypothetical protein